MPLIDQRTISMSRTCGVQTNRVQMASVAAPQLVVAGSDNRGHVPTVARRMHVCARCDSALRVRAPRSARRQLRYVLSVSMEILREKEHQTKSISRSFN